MYNIFVPKKWIEQDSETLTFTKKNVSDNFLNYCFNNIKNSKYQNDDIENASFKSYGEFHLLCLNK